MATKDERYCQVKERIGLSQVLKAHANCRKCTTLRRRVRRSRHYETVCITSIHSAEFGLALPSVIDDASSRTRVRSDTPMPSSDVGQRMRIDVPRPLDFAYC